MACSCSSLGYLESIQERKARRLSSWPRRSDPQDTPALLSLRLRIFLLRPHRLVESHSTFLLDTPDTLLAQSGFDTFQRDRQWAPRYGLDSRILVDTQWPLEFRFLEFHCADSSSLQDIACMTLMSARPDMFQHHKPSSLSFQLDIGDQQCSSFQLVSQRSLQLSKPIPHCNFQTADQVPLVHSRCQEDTRRTLLC